MFQAQITYRGPIEGKVKGMPAAVKGALTDAMLLWHSDIMPQHFAPQSQVDARYPGIVKLRGKGYMIHKNNKYHQQNLLEWSGQTKRNVSRGISVIGTSKELRGRLPGSQKLNFMANANAPKMRDELTTTNEQEAQIFAVLVDKKVGEFLNNNDGTKTVTP